MGTEISNSHFSHSDFSSFKQRLKLETDLLGQWFAEDRFLPSPPQGGFELEAWLIDAKGLPSPCNDRLMGQLNSEQIVPELARFNIEINSEPSRLTGTGLSTLHGDIKQNWDAASQAAERLGLRLLMIGTLPTALREHFCLGNISPLQRYHAINEQIFNHRQQRPVEIDIQGVDQLQHCHSDVMLEAATTSFQIHLRINADQAKRIYNASKIISAPLIAVAANSPWLFGHNLWAETRIPLFEQAVDIGHSDLTKRVSFGIRYIESSILEVFEANLKRYPVLLPELMDQPLEQLAHLRLHNGTIWRWNRPLIGFDPDSMPHIRIEQRSLPAGPTATDSVANAALYFGALWSMIHEKTPYEQLIPFTTARDNFYLCAKEGLKANISWSRGKAIPVKQLILEQLLPAAERGLEMLDIDRCEIDHWLGIIRQRTLLDRNGATWQRAWVEKHGLELAEMVSAYHHHQQTDQPVHTWPL